METETEATVDVVEGAKPDDHLYIRTDCSKCCFATVEEGRQVGCEMGRLAKYEARGVEIGVNEVDGVVYKMVWNTFCSAIRQPDWREARPDKSVDELRAEIDRDNRQNFTVVVYVPQWSTLEDVKRSVDSVKGSDLVTHIVVVLDDAQHDQHLETTSLFMFADDVPQTWDVVNLFEDKYLLKDYGGKTFLRAVDEAVVKARSVWYTAATAGYEWNHDLFRKVDARVNVDVMPIYCITPESGMDGFACMHGVHSHPDIGGNINKPVYKKLKEMGDDHEINYLTKWKGFVE